MKKPAILITTVLCCMLAVGSVAATTFSQEALSPETPAANMEGVPGVVHYSNDPETEREPEVVIEGWTAGTPDDSVHYNNGPETEQEPEVVIVS